MHAGSRTASGIPETITTVSPLCTMLLRAGLPCASLNRSSMETHCSNWCCSGCGDACLHAHHTAILSCCSAESYLNPGLGLKVGHCVAGLHLRQSRLDILRHILQSAEDKKFHPRLQSDDSTAQALGGAPQWEQEDGSKAFQRACCT